MFSGQTLFSQVMAYVPWKHFSRSVARFNGAVGFVPSIGLTCFASWCSHN